LGFAIARVDAPGGGETDARRLTALVETLTEKGSKAYRMKDSKVVVCSRRLEGFRCFEELAEAVERWLSRLF